MDFAADGQRAARRTRTPEAAVRVRSTRARGDAEAGGGVSLDDAILAGLAPDGGLFLPTRVPPLPADWHRAASIGDLAARVLAPWWGEAASEVAPLLREALNFEVPLVPLGEDRWLLELHHGPTLSFKDVGARSMARLAGRALRNRGGRATVLVATSGDTGSAVADGFAGEPGVRVVLLYPRGKVSEVQERQLIAAREGVTAYAVEGDFDDCQRLVKAAFRDPVLRDVGLTSANSINVGRLLPQMIYYLWAALRLRHDHGVDEAPAFVVPSGNLGNLTAGVLAERAGLPVAAWLAAHNANDYLPRHLEGRRAAFDFAATVATPSNAMDVGAPSNFERLHVLFGEGLGGRIDALSVSDDATLTAMRNAYEQDGIIVCPHTAVGLEGLRRWREAGRGGPAIVLATAHPAKFDTVVRAATGVMPPSAPALEALRDRPTHVRALAPEEAALRSALLNDAG